MEDGTNHGNQHEEQQQQQQQVSCCSRESTTNRGRQATSQVYDRNSKDKQELGGHKNPCGPVADNEGKMIESAANKLKMTTITTTASCERKIVKSLLVELNKFGKWQPQSDRDTQANYNVKTTREMAPVAKTATQPRLRQINIVGQLNHSAFRGMLTTCMSVSVIVLGALLFAHRPAHVNAAIWKSIFAGNHPSASSSLADNSAALKLPLVVSHLMTTASANSATNSLGNSRIWPISSSSLKFALGSGSTPTSGHRLNESTGESSSRSRAARHSDPGDLQRGVALASGHESANGQQQQQQQAAPMSQQFHYFWNHDQIDQKTVSDEAQKILADAQQQTDQIALSADLRRRDTSTSSSSSSLASGNSSMSSGGDQMAAAASGESAQVAQAIPPFIQQQLTSMVLHLQRQAQMSNMMQPRFGGHLLPATAQRRFESVASPNSALNPALARFWAASSSQHPVLALPPPPSSSGPPPFTTPLFSQLTPATLVAQAAGGPPLDAASAGAGQQLMQPRASLAGVPIYGPFMVAPTHGAMAAAAAAALGPASHSLHLPTANRQPQTGSRKRGSPSVPAGGARQSSASSRLTSTLFGRHRKGGWFGTGAQQVAAASGPRPTIVLPPAASAAAGASSLAAETARSLAASLPPESLALIEAASSQLANIIMNQMQARSAQQQQQHKMAIAAATAAALAARVQYQQQQVVDPQAPDQMQMAASAPVGQQQLPVDSQQLFELGSATVHGLSSLQPPYLLNAAQNLLAGPRGSAIANSLLGQYNQAMSMMQPAQVLELAKLGLPIQLGAFANTTDGGALQPFGSRLRRRQVAATPMRNFRHAPLERAAAAPYASPRPATASFDEPQVTFDRETGLNDKNTTPGGATEAGGGDSDDFGDSQAGSELTRSTLAPATKITATTTPVVLAGETGAGSARKARQLQPQQQVAAGSRSPKPRNVLMPREPINMRQLFVHSKQVAALNAAPGWSLGAPHTGGRATQAALTNNHLTPAASELFETVTHDGDHQNQLRRLKRSTSGWTSIDKTTPVQLQSDWASSSWQSHDTDHDDIKRVAESSSIMLKRQAELVGTGNATVSTGSGQQQVAGGGGGAGGSPGEASKRQDRAYKVKRITASASVMHHSQHGAARQHPIARLAANSGSGSGALAQRAKSLSSQFVPMQTGVGVRATPPASSTSQLDKATAAAAAAAATVAPNVAHVKQHASTSGGAGGGAADSLAVDPMAASLSESARVVNYFANVENDTPPPQTTTTTTRAPQPVQQIAATLMYQSQQHSATPPVMLASSQSQSQPQPGQQVPQINVGFAAPKVQRAAPSAAGGTPSHAHSGNSGGSGPGSGPGSVAASNSLFHTHASAKQRLQQNNQPAGNLKSLPVPAGSADISSAATGNHAYAVQQSNAQQIASQDTGGGGGSQQQQRHFGSPSGNQMLAGQQQLQQQLAQQAAFSARQIQLPQLTATAAAATASAHNKLLDNSLVNRNNLINTLLSMSPKSSASQQQQQQQLVSQQSQQVANKQQNLNSMDRSPMADQSNQYHDQILAPPGQQQQHVSMGGPPLGLYGAQMLGGGGGDTSTSGDQTTTSGNNQQQYQAYMEMNVNSGGQAMVASDQQQQQQQMASGDNRVESMIQQQQMQTNEPMGNLQQGQMFNGGAQDFGVRNSAAASTNQQQQQSSDLNLSEQSQMELSRFNNQQQQQQQLTSQQVAQLASQQQQLLSGSGSAGQSGSIGGEQSGQSEQSSFGTSGANVIQDALDGSLTATEATNNQLMGTGSELKWTTGSDQQQQQQLLEAQSQSLVNDAPSAQVAAGGSGAQLHSSNWPAALQAALASSQQSTRLNMQLEDALAVRNALLQSQIQQYNQQSSSPQSSGALERNFFSSSNAGSQPTSSNSDQANQLLLAAQSGIEEEAANAAAAAAGIPSYPSAAQLLAIQTHGNNNNHHHHQMSPLATAGALQLSRPQDFMSHQSNALLMAGSEKRESGGGSGGQGKRGKSGNNGANKKGPNKKGDLKHISHHYHFNSLGSPLEDPDNPLLTTSQLDFAGQIAANEQIKAEKVARQKRKQKEQEQQQQEEQSQQQHQEEAEQQKPKKKGFLRRFSIKNFFKRFRKDKQQKEHAQQQQQQSEADSQSADGGSDEQQSSGGGGESSGSSERAAAARAA